MVGQEQLDRQLVPGGAQHAQRDDEIQLLPRAGGNDDSRGVLYIGEFLAETEGCSAHVIMGTHELLLDLIGQIEIVRVRFVLDQRLVFRFVALEGVWGIGEGVALRSSVFEGLEDCFPVVIVGGVEGSGFWRGSSSEGRGLQEEGLGDYVSTRKAQKYGDGHEDQHTQPDGGCGETEAAAQHGHGSELREKDVCRIKASVQRGR